MKSIFNSILTFEVFFKILKFIDIHINPEGYGNTGLNSTNIHYYFGDHDGGSVKDVHYGHFKMIATREQVESLKKDSIVVEPFGPAANTEKSEYTVVVLNATGHFAQNYGIIFQQRGHMNAPIANTLMRVDLDIKEITTVIMLFPMNESISSTGNKVIQTQYNFGNLVYAKDGEIYIPYNKWELTTNYLRD